MCETLGGIKSLIAYELILAIEGSKFFKGFPCLGVVVLPNAQHAFGFNHRFFAHLFIAARQLHVSDVAKVADLFDLLHVDDGVFAQLTIHHHWARDDLPPLAVFAVLAA